MYDSLFIDLEPRMDTDELECLAAALTLMILSRHDRMIAENLDGLRRLGGFNALRVGDCFAEWTYLFQKLFLLMKVAWLMSSCSGMVPVEMAAIMPLPADVPSWP